jgi:RNase P subunit RPR2
MNDENQKTQDKTPKKYKRKKCNICGSLIYIANEASHRRSKKHKDALYIQYEMFEMIK